MSDELVLKLTFTRNGEEIFSVSSSCACEEDFPAIQNELAAVYATALAEENRALASGRRGVQ